MKSYKNVSIDKTKKREKIMKFYRASLKKIKVNKKILKIKIKFLK